MYECNDLDACTQTFVRANAKKWFYADGTRVFFRDALVGKVHIFKEIYVDKVYERFYNPKRGDVIFDVGDHIVLFTLKMSKAIGKEGRIFVFEPDPNNFWLMKSNLSSNSAPNVRAFQKAIGKSNRRVKMWSDPSSPSMLC
jgi:hypothetical protein